MTMGRFIDNKPLTVAAWRDEQGKPIWITSEEFTYEIGPKNSGWTITVPRGFETDLGSIPRLVRWLWNPSNPRCARAYVLHDYINQLTGQFMPNWAEGVSSQFAAAILYEVLTLEGEPLWSRKTQYFGVCLGINKHEW